MHRLLRSVSFLLLALPLAVAEAAPSVEARGLMRGMAVLVIDGTQRLLRVGEASPEGVELLAADTASAIVRVEGREFEISLSQRVGANFVAPEKREVRINRDGQGHFRVAGTIEGQPVSFLVDTGATVIAMSSQHARQLGIDYQASGESTQVITAAGPASSHYVRLNAVEVGGISVSGVQAAIVEGPYPVEILLGMSFLRHVGLSESAGVMTLTQDF